MSVDDKHTGTIISCSIFVKGSESKDTAFCPLSSEYCKNFFSLAHGP